MSHHPDLIDDIYMTEVGQKKLSHNKDHSVTLVGMSDLKEMSALKSNMDGLALIKMPPIEEWPQSLDRLGVFLDGVRDPGNMGTILRICDWFGIVQLWLSSDCVDIYNPKCVQASMGSLARVEFRQKALAEIRQRYSMVNIIGTAMDGTNYRSVKLNYPTIIVFGNESQGVRERTYENLDEKICIPRIGKTAESLNVAVTAGILLAHYTGSAHH
ncbi:MAG: RNA methyltransferase [Saprospiraceae bacterium]|nr:RNA methyltransferase [Saprospiraceae bacterium]